MIDDAVFRQIKAGNMDNFQYVFGAMGAGTAAVVDPGFEPKEMRRAAEALGLVPTHIVVTHAHWDHVQALDDLRRWTKAAVVAHPDSPVDPDVTVDDGDELTIAGVPVKALHAPGHCPDMVNFIVNDTWLITGDTLFVRDCGRTDLPGSDPRAQWDTLHRRYTDLPGGLIVCPGHDYGPTPTSTLDEERRHNPCLQPRTVDEFVSWMKEP